jgi:hypothetical protein
MSEQPTEQFGNHNQPPEDLSIHTYYERWGLISGLSYEQTSTVWLAAESYYDALPYHNFSHATEVLWTSMALADECAAHDVVVNRSVLLGAALFHDAGFHTSMEGHASKEAHSVALFKEEAPCLGFNDDQIERIERAILATKFGNTAHALEDKIIVRADLDNIGGDYKRLFMRKTELLRQESLLLNNEADEPFSRVIFLKNSIKILATYLSNDLSLGEFDNQRWRRRAHRNLMRLSVEFARTQGIPTINFIQSLGSVATSFLVDKHFVRKKDSPRRDENTKKDELQT